MTDEQVAARVAFVLCPPPDGFYDDKVTMTRIKVSNGVIAWTTTRAVIDGSRDYPRSEKVSRPQHREWGTYRMLPP